MASPPTTGHWKAYLEGDSAHFTPLPDFDGWKFYSDFDAVQFRYYHPDYNWFFFSERYFLPDDRKFPHGLRWRVAHAEFGYCLNSRYKTQKGAIRAIEARGD